ncbi:hypothetical protein, partial [Rhizobium sp. P40RR-XXII]|uniref:hypothetical protein n=1 Tax=Rhizobium sp. P40RR-XXII TaxID=2726739 RepID=UPI0019805F00
PRTQIAPGPASFAAHVSLSSHLQLSNNRPVKPVKNLIPAIPGQNPEPPISIAANQGNTRAKVVVASSAAALVQ